MSPKRPALCDLLLACLLLVLIFGGVTTTSLAQDELSIAPVVVCEPPISTCRQFPIPLASRPDIYPVPDDCPAGFACTCVPSCPECDDCAAQVCVRGPSRECRTACDCAPGLGCFDGQCIAGFAPVYCCDSGICPAGEMCQSEAGGMGRCKPDPSCGERVQKVSRLIQAAVERANRCDADRDCVRVSTDTECGGTCGAYVNRERAKHFEKAVDWFDAKICSDYQKDGCPFATPGCLATVPRCVNHRCEGAPIRPGPPPEPLLEQQGSGSGAVLNLEPAR